jgi:organic hydroperoxide reductase OsmC/OhrA
MSELSINLKWGLGEGELIPGKIPNSHEIIFNKDHKIISDAAPDWGGNSSNTNPEQALAASVSSCHMMTFLALAAKMKWPVCSYEDKADAVLGKNSKGQMAVTKITLHPVVGFEEDFSISDQEMKEMHDRSHRYCFVANSLSDEVGFEVVL